MSKEEYAELNYRLGHLPLWMYCQLNGRRPQENYELQRKTHLEQIEQEQTNKRLFNQTQDEAQKIIEKAIEDLLKDFNND